MMKSYCTNVGQYIDTAVISGIIANNNMNRLVQENYLCIFLTECPMCEVAHVLRLYHTSLPCLMFH